MNNGGAGYRGLPAVQNERNMTPEEEWEEEKALFTQEKKELDRILGQYSQQRVKDTFLPSHQENHRNDRGFGFKVRDASDTWIGAPSDLKCISWREARLFFTSPVLTQSLFCPRVPTLGIISMIPIARINEMAMGMQKVLQLCSTDIDEPPMLGDDGHMHLYVGLQCFKKCLHVEFPQLTNARLNRLTNSLPPSDDFFRIPNFKNTRAYTDFFLPDFFYLNCIPFAARGHVAREITSATYWRQLFRSHESYDEARKMRDKKEQKAIGEDPYLEKEINVEAFVSEFRNKFEREDVGKAKKENLKYTDPVIPRSQCEAYLQEMKVNTMCREQYITGFAHYFGPELKLQLLNDHPYIVRAFDSTFEPEGEPCTVRKLHLPAMRSAPPTKPCFCYSLKGWNDSSEPRTVRCYRHRENGHLSNIPKAVESDEVVKAFAEQFYRKLKEERLH